MIKQTVWLGKVYLGNCITWTVKSCFIQVHAQTVSLTSNYRDSKGGEYYALMQHSSC